MDYQEVVVAMNNQELEPLTRWGIARKNYLLEHKKSLVRQLGVIGLHKHCLEIQEQAQRRKDYMMSAIRKDPRNKVTESDKAQDPMAWVGRMNNYQNSICEIIYVELIYT